ncbi:testis-expressed protein 19.2 [Tupaia chinensis]|nr:testis-expressed protein 19.2 [Tupaia chinensis]ELW68180.1 Testis-expressed protein 19.2 [Tupaia chinensis]
MDDTGAGSEHEGSPGVGLSWGQGSGQTAQGGPGVWGPGALASASASAGSEEAGLDYHFVPTELEPQDTVPLTLGLEDADWTQGLPWRFGGVLICSHWPSLPPPWQEFLKVDLPPGEPMVLELSASWAMDPAEAEACLLDLKVVSMVGCYDAVYLRKMTPGRASRTSGQHWSLLLEPDEVWVVRLQDAPQEPDLHRWKLSILEPSFTGYSVELVPADTALQKRGFTIVSYSPWIKRQTEEGDPASRPRSSSRGQDPSTSENWRGGPRDPGENLAVMGASAQGELPCFEPLDPGPQNGGDK